MMDRHGCAFILTNFRQSFYDVRLSKL